MDEILAYLIENASGTLAKLTKIRCVETYPMPPNFEARSLFSWPNTRYISEEGARVLKGRGVFLRDSRVKTYSVPYNLYDRMKRIYTPSVDKVEATRALLDVFRIVSGHKSVTGITAAWDTAECPSRVIPKSISDTQGWREFGTRRDSFLVFHREGEKYDIKLRPSVLPVVLRERPDIRGLPIFREDLREFVGDNVDDLGRKNRNIVFQENLKYLQDVVRQTNDAVEKLVGNKSLAKEVKKLYRSQ